jgi:hypothetical protein
MELNLAQQSNQQILMPPPQFPPLNNPQMNDFQAQNYNQQMMAIPPPNYEQNNQLPIPFQGMQFIYVIDPLAELGSCTGVEIKQQPEFFEMVTGCETANRYHVFGQSPQGNKYLFKCNERSGWCMRNCCPSNSRQFDMIISHITSANNMGTELKKDFANIFKPFKCTICCLNRPQIFLTLNDGNKRLGMIKHVCTFCDPEFEVYDENGTLKYIITADCCQCGLICNNNFFGKLSEVIFNILAPNNNQVVGTIVKKSANFSEVVTDADSYQINFPTSANPTDKLLIIALGLMIDYQFFETKASGEQNNRRNRRYHY